MATETNVMHPAQMAPHDPTDTAVTPDVLRVPQPIVNVYLVGTPGSGDREWVLVDAGLPGTAGQIARAAAERFGVGARPAAIILTHGHFDHISAAKTLADKWDAPVYVHPLELPYVTGRSAYPPPDPTVGGGMMSLSAPLFPRKFDLGARVRALPGDGGVPGLSGWRAVHTPGHSPGHVSLWRESDGTLIVGDAFVTTQQESAVKAFTKPVEIHGPPMYFTPDWESSRRSVASLAALRPQVAATGHGLPMRGADLTTALDALARDFESRAVPQHGRYVGQRAVTDETGVVSVPPPRYELWPVLLLLGASVAAGVALTRRERGKRQASDAASDFTI